MWYLPWSHYVQAILVKTIKQVQSIHRQHLITSPSPLWKIKSHHECWPQLWQHNAGNKQQLPLGPNTTGLVSACPSHQLCCHRWSRWNYLTVSAHFIPWVSVLPFVQTFPFQCQIHFTLVHQAMFLFPPTVPNCTLYQTAGPCWLHQRFCCLSHPTCHSYRHYLTL